MDREKLLDRIRRLYAMAQDTSSPNEATIAARRVRALMDENGITVEDIEQKQHDFLAKAYDSNRKTMPTWMNALSYGVAQFNDCEGLLLGGQITFYGFDVDVLSSHLMMDYLIQAMERQLRDARDREQPDAPRSWSTAFRNGFVIRIQERLLEMVEERKKHQMSDGRSLVVVKQQLVRNHFGLRTAAVERGARYNSSGLEAGKAAGDRTSLNSQVGGRQQGALA